MNIHDWFVQWGIPHAAQQDYFARMGVVFEVKLPAGAKPTSEATVQAACRIEAPKHGDRLWRNNVGALKDEREVPVRYGLANDSKQVNEVIKSGDLIGVKRTLITPQMVGQVIGKFWSRECKPSDWVFTGTAREIAQLAWANHVNALGGDAGFISDPSKLY